LSFHTCTIMSPPSGRSTAFFSSVCIPLLTHVECPC
jgi:hypothetical protein